MKSEHLIKMLDLDNCVVLQTEYPTYMQEIFRKSEDITLIHQKSNPNPEETFTDISMPNIMEQKSPEIELIGNPLKIDLRNDDDLNLAEATVVPDNWTKEEATQYPIESNFGRKLLNMKNGSLSYNPFSEDDNINSCPVFVLIDPKCDAMGTFLLGSNVPYNTKLISYIKGCYSRDDPEMDPEKMLEKHRKKHRSANKITSTVTTVYSIKGWNMKNNQQSSCYNSILIEVTWNTCSKLPILNKITNSRVKLQIMNGHPDSPFSHIWHELEYLRFLLEMYKDEEFSSDSVLPFNPTHISNICNEIKNIMQPGKLRRTKDLDFNKLDLKNREDADFLDKLWGILLRAENINDLNECIIILFEEFAAQSGFILNKIQDYNATSIGIIIKGICEGTMAVPNITPAQALLYLIELGIQKLKNDYVNVVDHCYRVKSMDIINYWNEISKTVLELSKESNLQSTGSTRITMVPRRTRITMARNQDGEIVNSIMKQVNYLANLHVMEQFVYLAHTELPLEIKESLIGPIINKYCNGGLLTLEQLHEKGFQEIILDLHNPLYLSYLESLDVVSWNLNNHSKHNNSEVTSIFHYSEKPIIPSCIFNDYNILSENQKYYLTETYVLTN